jgi:hypothetical protein
MKRIQTSFPRHGLAMAVLLLAACGKPLPQADGSVAARAPEAGSAPMPATAAVPVGDAPSVDDLAVATRVRTAFEGDPNVKALDLQVMATKGDLRLIGKVDRPDQKDRAIELARSIEGVHSIHDEVTLKP